MYISISNDFGVLECWSVGVVDIELGSYFLQHSNAPPLQYSKADTFNEILQPSNCLKARMIPPTSRLPLAPDRSPDIETQTHDPAVCVAPFAGCPAVPD